MSSHHAHSQSHSASDDHSTSDSQTHSNSHSHSHSQVPEINRIIIQSLIHQKLDEVRSGELYVAHDLKDDSVPKLLLEPEVYKKFESILAKTWMEIDMLRLDVHETGMNGGKLNKKKKLYTRALGGREAREFVRGQIEDYIVLHLDRGGVGGVGPGRKDSDMDIQMAHEHGQLQHDHDSSDEESDHANANADESDMENDTVSSLSDGKISRSSSKKRKKKKKSKKKRRKEKERERERKRSRSKSRSSSSSKSKSSSKSRKSSSSKSSSKKRKRRESREEDEFDSDSDVEQMQEQEEIMDMPEEDMEDHAEELDDDEEDQEQIDDNSDSDENDEPQLTPREQARYDRRIAKAQAIFERNRKNILQQIPEKSKREFRTLGFAKWGKDFLPVMVLGPYDVGPGGVRDQWMQMFENTIKSGRPMSKLVFWYGTPHDDLSNSFSFVAGSKIVSLPTGQKQHLHELPAKTQKKLDSGKKLTAAESMHVNGLKEFMEDVGRKPEDRSEWLFDFEEDYEECLSAVEDDTSDEEGDMEDENAHEFDEEDNRKKKVKADKNKKHKKEKSKMKQEKEKVKEKTKNKEKLKEKEKLKQQRLKEKKKEELRIEKEQRKIEQQQQEQLERERERLQEKAAKKKKKKKQRLMEEEDDDIKDSHYDAPSKKKSPSKRKKEKVVDNSTLASSSPSSPPKEKKKKKRKLEEQSTPVAAKPSLSKSKSALSSPLPTTCTTSVKPKIKKQKKSLKSLDEEIEAEVAEETQLMEEMRQDPPSEDDEDDDDFSVNGKVSESDDSDDEDAGVDIDMEEEDLGYDDDSVSLSRKKSKSAKKSKSTEEKKKKKAPVVEKKDKATVKSKTTLSSTKKRKSAPVHQTPEEIREQELFEECEKIFIPIMSMLVDPSSITATKAEKLMRKIDRDVHRLTPAFFRTHGIGLIVKGVRAHFKESNNAELNQLCKQLTANMKKVFHSKVGSEPKGFNPVSKKSVKKKAPAKTAATPKVKREKSPVNVKQDKEIGLDTSMASEKSSVSGSVTIKEVSIPQKPVIKEEVKIPVVSSSSIPKKGDFSAVKEEFKVKAKAAIIKQEVKKTPKPDKPKPARKSFSLAGMFAAPAAATPTPTASSSIEKSVDMDKSTHSSVEVKEEQPKWIINYQPTGQQNTYESNPDREYAMEFLIEAANCFPEGRVDARSVARALEDALWTRYDSDLVKYMDRVHDICAAIAGKRQLGSLAQKIMSGDYSTPLDVINIPRKLLFQSFEGFWIP